VVRSRGRLKIGIVARDGRIDGPVAHHVRRLLDARQLSDYVDFVAVDHSYQELVDVQEHTIAAEVEDLLHVGRVSHGIDTSRNAIIIDVASTATAEERDRLRRIADQAPVRVVLRDTNRPSLVGTLE
jgi:hypothetical protein